MGSFLVGENGFLWDEQMEYWIVTAAGQSELPLDCKSIIKLNRIFRKGLGYQTINKMCLNLPAPRR